MVNTQEFVRSSGHVDKVGFALGTLTVKELVDRLVLQRAFQMCTDNLEQGLAQMRRTALGGTYALRAVLAGLIYTGVNAGEGNESAAVGKTADIANLSHKLSAGNLAHTVHGALTKPAIYPPVLCLGLLLSVRREYRGLKSGGFGRAVVIRRPPET